MKIKALALLALLSLSYGTLFAQTPGPVTAAEAGSLVGTGLGGMSAEEAKSGLLGWLGDILGMEVGTLSVSNTQYSKVTFSPEVRIGRLKFGLYLPIIYRDDMFDSSTWYRPEGNDEWSFGQGLWETDPAAAFLDTLSDAALKIKYIEYGEQLSDPFFLKVGNLHTLTVGHGLLMRNYRNNTEFPAVRRVGFNTGIDFGAAGFEALVNDLSKPRVFGSRIYVRPFGKSKLAVGVSAVLDSNPGKDLPAPAPGSPDFQTGNMMFLGAGLDLDFPIIKRSALLGLRAYAGAAATVPWVQETFVSKDKTIEPGLKYQLFWNDGKPTNWGANAGFMGNLWFLDWRAEYRYFTGLFRPALFDSLYERSSGALALEYRNYLDGTKSISTGTTFSGIYGEASFDIIFGKLTFAAGYLWPFVPGIPLTDEILARDKLEASLIVKKGLIPFINLAGQVSFIKRGLAKSISEGTFTLFDSDSILAGEVILPVPRTPNLDIAFMFQTVVERDEAGGVKYLVPSDPSKGVSVKPSIGIETRFHF